ncbi:SMI1/KNR4 family protein [Metabacillus arenae]|uniref:SMI1/KNR4 family protein n=1 Tax=Metabacillus arenae TaxID=2771434 RepID=A0A926RYF7_9BACI|nr:SMI1/KNR4 family protein [Metabacillus arenae]MBD1381695.1 SMI1/KNR4 family protein [Metabacillus arenae]
MKIIYKTLEALKNKLDDEGNMEVIAEQGNIHTVNCSFNSPICNETLLAFQQESNWTLPDDYKEFLTHHNGARIFEMLLGKVNIGGGLRIYSMQEIQKTYENLQLTSTYYPIGYVLESYLLINNKDIEQKNLNYLFIASTFPEIKPLNLNFELFFDRFIISQGANFWDWPNYTAKNYYKYQGGIEF